MISASYNDCGSYQEVVVVKLTVIIILVVYSILKRLPMKWEDERGTLEISVEIEA